MTIDDLVVSMDNKSIVLKINKSGFVIINTGKEGMSLHEMQYAASIAFDYIGQYIKNENIDPDELIELSLSSGFVRYKSYHDPEYKKHKLN